jgi:hypothetical protein
MSALTVITSVVGIGDITTLGDTDPLSVVNNAAQVAALTAAANTLENPFLASQAISAGGVAFYAELAVTATDLSGSAAPAKLAADFASLIGDATIIVAGMADLTGNVEVGDTAAVVGAFATGGGLAADIYLAKNPSPSSASVNGIAASVQQQVVNCQATLNALTTYFDSLGGSEASYWNTTDAALVNGLNSASSMITDAGNTNTLTDATAAYDYFNGSQTDFGDLLTSTGNSATTIAATEGTDSTISVMNNGEDSPDCTGTLTISDDGSTTGIATADSSGDTTVNETSSINSSTGSVFGVFQLVDSGTVTGEEDTLTTSAGVVSGTISGDGISATLSDATVTLENGAQASLYGDNNSFSGGYGTFALQGNGNELLLSGESASSITATGNDNILEANEGSTLNLSGTDLLIEGTYSDVSLAAGSQADFDSGGIETVTLGANCSVTSQDNIFSIAAGSGNTETFSGFGGDSLFAGSGADLIIDSGGENITGYDDFFTVDDDTDQTFGGTDLSIDAGDGSDITFEDDALATVTNTGDPTLNLGNGDNITASNDTISVTGSSDTDTLYGSTDTITVGTSDTLTVENSGNTIALGNHDTLTASSETLNYSTAGDTDTITGGANTINAGTGSTIDIGYESSNTISSTGDTVNDGDGCTTTVSSSTVSLASTYNGIVDGNGDTINLAGGNVFDAFGTTNVLNVSGTSDVLFADDSSTIAAGSSMAITLTGGSAATVTGTSETLYLQNGDNITATGSHDLYSYSAGGGGDTIRGGGGTDTLKLGGSLTLANVTFGFANSGNDLLLTDTTGGDAIDLYDQFTGGSTVALQDLVFSDGTSLVLSNLVIDVASSSSVSLAANSETAVVGSSDTITVGSNAFVAVSGNDTFYGSSGDDTLWSAGGSTETFGTAGNSANDTIYVGSGSTLSLSGGDSIVINSTGDTIDEGSGDNIGCSSESLVATSGWTEAVTGSNDTINLASGTLDFGGSTQITDTGNNNTIEWSTNDTLSISSSSTDTLASTGGNDTISGGAGSNLTFGSGETVSLTGSGDTFYGTSGGGDDTLYFGAGSTETMGTSGNSANDTINGGNGIILTLASGDSIVIDSTGDTIDLGSGDNIGCSSESLIAASGWSGAVTGTNDTISLAAGSLLLGGNTQVTVTGNGDTFSGNSGNDTLTFSSGATETLVVYANSANDTINGGNGIDVTLGVADSIAIDSTGDTIDVGLGDNITCSSESLIAGLSGYGGAVTGTDDTINLASGTLYLGWYTQINDTGTGSTISLLGGGASVTGTSENLFGVGGETQTLSGTGDTINAGTGSTVSFGSGAGVDVTSTGDTLDLTDGDVITGSSETFNIGSNETVTLAATSSYDTIVGGNSDLLYVYGSTDTVTATNSHISFIGGSGDSASGSGNTCSGGSGDPIILNLDGDPVATTSLAGSSAFFNVLNNGQSVQTAWTTADEGFLVYDPDDTNSVTSAANLVSSFAELETLDSNGDGVLNASDAAWSDLKVWINSAGDGVFQSGDLYSMSALGIAAIDLDPTTVNATDNGNTILQESTFVFTNGSTGDLASVFLNFDADNTYGSGLTTINGTSGNDTLTASNGYQILNGNGGNDTFIGASGTVVMHGDEGIEGNNLFIAGQGITTAFGGTGNDTYSFAASDGLLAIHETGGSNIIALSSGISAGAVSLSENSSGSDLLVSDGVVGDQIDIANDLYGGSNVVQALAFADGSTMNLTGGMTISAAAGNTTLNGLGSNDTLIATAGNQELDGNAGSDSFIGYSGTGASGDTEILNGSGGTGNQSFLIGQGTTTADGGIGDDVYSYASGDGLLTINESGGNNTLAFASGLTASNLSFSENSTGTDLLITDGVSGDQIDIHNDLESTSFQVQTIAFADGSSMNLNGGLTLTAADADGATLNALSGNDTLIASAGGQTLNGEGGVYDFGSGDGADTIVNNGSAFDPSGQLVFGSGVADDQVWIDRVDNSGNVSSTGNNLRFDILGTTDSITVDNWYGSTSSQLASATLSGSGLTVDAQLASLVQAMASFETAYQASTGTAFDPTATANGTITNSALLAAVNSAWHH